MLRYSASANAFFETEIHGDAIPADAMEVSRETYDAIQDKLSKGGTLKSGKAGRPSVIAPPAVDEEKRQREIAKVKARAYLNETDWYIIREIETGRKVPDEIKEARTKARKDQENDV